MISTTIGRPSVGATPRLIDGQTPAFRCRPLGARRGRTGQSLVEFALVLPLLVVLIAGLAEVGLLLYAHVQVANASREAARAGSLYLPGRFHYTLCDPNVGCPANFGSGGEDCWSLTAWVENALVAHGRGSNGCPTTGYDTSVHSLGSLSPTHCPSASSGTSCWWLAPVSATLDPGSGLPVPGTPLTVTVTYRYDMPIFGSMLNIFSNPVVISKTMVMAVQAK
jgi:hypothetical protein